MKDPKRTPLQCTVSVCVVGVHCWGDLLGVNRSMERDLLSVLSIYPGIFLCVFIVHCLLVGFPFVLLYSTMFMCFSCFGLVVSTCQVIGYRKTPLIKVKVKVKVHTLNIAPLHSESPPQKCSGMARVLKVFQFYLHTHTFIRNWNEPYLPLPSQPKLVLIYRPRGMEG